jgi:hypothetical protein
LNLSFFLTYLLDVWQRQTFSLTIGAGEAGAIERESHRSPPSKWRRDHQTRNRAIGPKRD